MKEMFKLIKSCPKDATFLFTYEIAQLDRDFMKRSEKFNEAMRKWEQEDTNKLLKEKIKGEKKIQEKEEQKGEI